MTLANLRLCFPALTEAERRALGRRCFQHMARALLDHPTIPTTLISKVDLDNVRFVSNDRLLDMMSRTMPPMPKRLNSSTLSAGCTLKGWPSVMYNLPSGPTRQVRAPWL